MNQCFKCLVCNQGFKGGEKLKRDEWGGLVHSNISIRQKCVTPVRELFHKNAFVKTNFLDGRMNCLSCASDGVYDVETMEEVEKRVWPTLSKLGFLASGECSYSCCCKEVIDKQALKINARGNLRGLNS